MVKRKKGSERHLKTGFEHFLKMDMQKDIAAKDDLKWERKLAKKLRVKEGKLWGVDDDINLLFEEIPSIIDSLGEGEISDAQEFSMRSSVKKRKKLGLVVETNSGDVALEQVSIKTCSSKKHEELPEQGLEGEMTRKVAIRVAQPVKTYGPEVVMDKAPALEESIKYKAPYLRSCEGDELEEYHQIQRQIRGLLNRLCVSNMESITKEIVTIFHSVDRSVSSQIISEEVLASCSGGHRGSEQCAAVFAAFVAGMAYLVGNDFSAELVASLAKSFEDEYLRKEDLSLRNLTLLLSYLYIFNVFTSDLIYDLLTILSKQLLEIDISTILTILQCSGMKLRHDDPVAMKNFILSVQNRMNELKATSEDVKSNINNKRMAFMLETICNIKNNIKSPKEDTVQSAQINKWLQKLMLCSQLRVEDIVIRGLKWSKLLDIDKSGHWWLSSNMAFLADNAEEVAARIDGEVLEVQKMLQLAATLGMNTDARRAIFCVIMTSVDVLDAFQKLLRLDLPGKQDRDIMRVILRCCLREELFNKYYTILASHLCKHDKNQKYTLQYCLWDHFKRLESMEPMTSSHLARFVAEMLASFTLSLAVLKTVELSDSKQLTPTRIMHFRMLFEAMFKNPDRVIWNIFKRIAVAPELETLRNGIKFFIREYVVSRNKGFAGKFKVAKRALNSVEVLWD